MIQPRRQGLTIVEMLVAMALILFIMAILAEAFVAGLDSFRHLKAIGDMNTRLRSATALLRRDLRADHFGDKPLSQLSLPPSQGFLRLFQGSPPIDEGADADGVHSYRATDQILHFTINLSVPNILGGSVNRREDYLFTAVPGSPLLDYGPAAFQDGVNFYSQWAEVAYFVKPTGTYTTGPDPLPLFGLYRRELLIYQPNSDLPDLNLGLNRILSGLLNQYSHVSAKQDPLLPLFLFFNTPQDLTIPVRRFGMQPTPFPNLVSQLENAGLPINGTYPTFEEDSGMQAYAGSDLLLHDVVSFEVKITTTGGGFVDLFDSSLQSLIKNPAFKGQGKPRVFDTWSKKTDLFSGFAAPIWSTVNTFKSLPLNVSVKAMQVTIRIWDRKTEKTRQVTIIQDM